MPPDKAPTTGYRALLAIGEIPRLLLGLLLGRAGESMFRITLVLFVLTEYHSPELAGLAVFAAVAPGLVASPFAGALLDRHGRVTLVTLDYLVSATALAAMALLGWNHALPPAGLLALTGVKSLTSPLGQTGLRTALPLIVPARLWDVANGADSAMYVITDLTGPALAGVLVASFRGEGALLAGAAIFAAAAGATATLRVPDAATVSGSLLRSARDGIRYVIRNNPTLRGLAVAASLGNIGWGMATIAIPVLALRRFDAGAVAIGWLFALIGAGGLVSGLTFGRLGSINRERTFIMIGIGTSIPAYLAIAAAPTIWVVAVALVLFGANQGPYDIGLFALRQRRTPPEWFGRAFAVSASLNFSGLPIGAAIGGPIAAWSPTAAIALAALLSAVSLAAARAMIPPSPV